MDTDNGTLRNRQQTWTSERFLKSSSHGTEVRSLSAYRLTFPVDDQRLHQRVELPEMLVCGLHLLQLLLKPLQQKKPQRRSSDALTWRLRCVHV